MSKKTDSNSYTMMFAIGMVLVVGSLLAFLASSLKPNISENKRIEKQQNILYAMGVNENDESSAIFVSTSAISCTLLYLRLGAKIENIVMCDSKGVIKIIVCLL